MLRKIFLITFIALSSATMMFAQGGSTSTTAATAKAGPAKKPAIFRPTKDQIKQVQAMLNEKKLYTGEASGTYNDSTRGGIKSFQKDNGLKETGTLNRATLEKFGVEMTDNQKLIPVSQNSYADSAADTKPATSVKTASAVKASMVSTDSAVADKTTAPAKPKIFRATVDQIKAAQKMLKEKSMYSGEESGKLDDATRDGLKKFQEGNGVKVTGTLNGVTLEKMGIGLTDSQKANTVAAPKN